MDEIERARAAIDAAHAADPDAEAGVAGEVRYAHRIEDWIRRLCGQPSPELLLAARAQHLERWAIPREEYPAGRGGYLRWRGAVHARQGDRARQLLTDAGCDATLAARVASLVSKSAPRDDPDAQALEDAACLVFLETELAAFAAEHPREKTIDILRKTWRKMSPAGQQAALGLTLPGPAQDLVRAALG
jgi:tRNAThr (cytosine32-N3)-methyltransferase